MTTQKKNSSNRIQPSFSQELQYLLWKFQHQDEARLLRFKFEMLKLWKMLQLRYILAVEIFARDNTQSLLWLWNDLLPNFITTSSSF